MSCPAGKMLFARKARQPIALPTLLRFMQKVRASAEAERSGLSGRADGTPFLKGLPLTSVLGRA
jgi:hypothetical protein